MSKQYIYLTLNLDTVFFPGITGCFRSCNNQPLLGELTEADWTTTTAPTTVHCLLPGNPQLHSDKLFCCLLDQDDVSMTVDEVSKIERSSPVDACAVATICNCRSSRWNGVLFRRFHPGADAFKRGLKHDCSVRVDVFAGHRFRQVCTECDGILIIRLLPGCHSREHKCLSVQVSCELKLGQESARAELSPRPGPQKSAIVLLSGSSEVWRKDPQTDTIFQRQWSIN